MHTGDGQTISSVLEGCSQKRGGGSVNVYMRVFPSSSHLSKITQAELALQKPLPRQLESEQL